MPSTRPVITEECLRRLWRVGHCVILAAEVSYPRLEMPEGEAPSRSIARFNEGYRVMAEAFLGWAESTPAQEAADAFATLGVGAAYIFDRRLITCRMRVVPEEASKNFRMLTVEREVLCTSRRGSVEVRRAWGRDVWRWPDLTPAQGGTDREKKASFRKKFSKPIAIKKHLW